MLMKSCSLKFKALALTIFLLSCSSNRSLVVLLPDTDGKVGQIEVTTDKGTQKVEQAYHSVQTGTRDDAPSAPAPMEQNKIMDVFGQALAAQPDPRFRLWTGTLYCKNGSVDLIDDSHKALREIIKEFKNNSPVEIYVIGHADRVGPEKYNINLSHRRSVWIKDNFIAGGIKSKIILISFYGESKPQVSTEDEIPEPLNRRVELVAKFPKP
jgi:outer membrane protein OmpA-like peptidoglycan-associated protein